MVERLITELAEQPAAQGEPWAWFVYVEEASNGYVVDDINDRQLIDDVTNHNAKVTPLYPIPDPRIVERPAEPQGEPVAWLDCIFQGPPPPPYTTWYDWVNGKPHRFVRVQSTTYQDPRIAALEALLRALDSLTNPDENFDSAINPGPERDELLAAYTACKDVPR